MCFSLLSNSFSIFILISTIILLFIIRFLITINRSSSSSSFAPPSSHQSSYPPRKHDVFLSFRGEDTRDNFASHLYNALDQKKILTFIDNVLVRGDEISSSLWKAIEQSKISVVVFSQDYASSKWCLRELVKILDCRRNNGQKIIPVFYRVDPSHVQNQTGNFGAAFGQHKKSDEVQSWRDALKEVAHLSGWDSSVIRPESKFIKKIIKDVLKKLNNTSIGYYHEGFVGIESRIQHVETLLSLESQDVIIVVGIWGMGGLGKTTLARAIYDQISTKFEKSCFVSNTRVQKMDQLQNELFPALLGEGNVSISTHNLSFVKDRLSRKKVLVVVDDFRDGLVSEFAKFLCPGSRILLTSRDMQPLKNIADERYEVEIYEMEKLNEHEALQLFSMYAFKQYCPPSDHILQGKRVVSYAKGNPLALKVLGSKLFGTSDQDWNSMLEGLGNIRNPEIHDVLKTSYDGLGSDEVKRIFLAIACLFRGKSREYVTEILDVAFEFSVCFSITTLIRKSLITVNYGNVLEMHDLLQEMGKNIAAEPKNTKWLTNPKHLNDALMENKANGAIDGISLNMSMVAREIHLEPDVFTKMHNLRFLNLYWPGVDFRRYGEEKLHLSRQGLRFPKTLSYLSWTKFPLKSIPSKFFPENLVVLQLRDSKVKNLWDGEMNLVNLIEIDLSNSKYLTEIPDLSKAIKIETIDLSGCEKLKNLPRRIESNALKFLSMGDCLMMDNFPEITQVNMNLFELLLWGCRKLRRLPDSICNLISLHTLTLGGSGIEELPSSIEHLSCLLRLDLSDCRNLKSLPSCIYRLPELRILDLKRCASLRSLPEVPPSLSYLDADDCKSLQTISRNFTKCCDLLANFGNCWRLDQKPLEAEAQFITENCHCELLYSGSEVPGWFTHRSTGSSIDVQFPSNWDQFKGVVFCISYELRKTVDDYGSAFGFQIDPIDSQVIGEVCDRLWGCRCPHNYKANGDYVLIVYQSDNPFKEYFATLSSFQLSSYAVSTFSKRYKNPESLKVKKWGVHLVQGQVDAESIISQTLSSSGSAAETTGIHRHCVGSSAAAASTTSSGGIGFYTDSVPGLKSLLL